MAQRRPFPMGAGAPGAGASPLAAMSGQGPTMPKPGMTMAPAGNANPDSKGGTPMMPSTVPPPIDPTAGGPTAPGNIQQMLATNMGDAGGQQPPTSGPARRALPPWGTTPPKAGAGADAMTGDNSDVEDVFGHASGGATDLAGLNAKAGKLGDLPPMVMLRLLKATGHL